MKQTKQLKQGIKVEAEHKSTYNMIKKKGLPSFKKFTTSIATDHIKENKKYYTKLKRCKL